MARNLSSCGPELTIQDWGVTYDELEPHYDRFDYLCGTSGKAGNIKGQIQPGGNPFEGPRSREYPTPPMKEPYFGALFRKGANELGYHPYPAALGEFEPAYTNPKACRSSNAYSAASASAYACEHYAKSSPQTIILPVLLKNPNYELRTNCQVLRVNLDSTGKKATGVTYVDAAGTEYEQPADLVLITAFRAEQRAHAAALRDRQALRSQNRRGRRGAQLPYQTVGRRHGLHGRKHQHQSVHGIGRQRRR